MHSIYVCKPCLRFSAAHFLVSHEKCGRMHGHNYKVRVRVRGEPGRTGIIIDFHALVKRVLAICGDLDHKMIVPQLAADITVQSRGEQVRIIMADRFYELPSRDVAMLPIPASTAESLAEYFFNRLNEELSGLEEVEIEESPGSVACYRGEGH